MRQPFARSSIRSLAAALVVLVTAAVLAQAQAPVQEPPLFRESTSTIAGNSAATVLAADPGLFVQGDGALAMGMNYKCIDQASASDSAPNHPNCNLGEQGATAADPRRVVVEFSIDGTDPAQGNAKRAKLLQTGTGNLPPHADENFAGSIPAAQLAGGVDGDELLWRVLVNVTSAGIPAFPAPLQCSGSTNCHDPRDTTGQGFYRARLDYSTPEILVSSTANSIAVANNTTAVEWLIYSNSQISARSAGSSLLPEIVITVVDNFNGSQLDKPSIRFLRNQTDQTTNFVQLTATNHTATYRYNYQVGSANQFQDNTSTRIDVRADDLVGHHLDTANDTNPAVWVVMDITRPELQNGSLTSRGDPDVPASLGEGLVVHVNATDFAGRKVTGGNLSTPPKLLKVEVELMSGPGNSTRSPKIEIPYNEGLGHHFSDNVTVPSTWVTGLTYANVTVTDPAENTVTAPISGSVAVDVDVPTVTPIAPIGTGNSTGFSKQTQVAFQLRAIDPGDSDSWNGANTQDTDNIGIDHSEVRLHYRVGATGPITTAQMTPQTADHTFAVTRTFNAIDHIYYYFTAKDIAGNTVPYPAAGDPFVNLGNTTENGGRFLSVQIDQAGPVVSPAKDHAYLGRGPHEVVIGVTDAASGVDAGSVTLNWRLQGESTYREVDMARNTTGNTSHFVGEIPAQADGARVQWYATALDILGNPGTLGTATSPQVSVIDTVPPTVTVNAPATAANARFDVSWTGTDAASGIRDYTLQFRLAPGGAWFTVPTRENTTQTSYEVCAAAGKTYEFRVAAEDRAGNLRTPTAADATTRVTATENCAQPADVTITQPISGATLTGAATVAWNAVSLAFPGELEVRISAGTGSAFTTIADDLASTGTYNWNTAAPNLGDTCLPDGTYTLRVTAVDPIGLEGQQTVSGIVLSNGIVNCDDRDNDGLPDDWEFANFGNLDSGPSQDSDSDGFTNLQEFQAGSDPNSASSRPGDDGNGPAGGWNNLYILVILAFVAVLGVFVVGVTRRW